MRIKPVFSLFLLIPALASACTRVANAPVDWTPDAPVVMPLPTSAPIQTYMPATRAPGAPLASPTPDMQANILPTFTPLPTSLAAAPGETPAQVTYTVQAGDYLGSIANSYGITVEELATANNLDPNYAIIYPGDVLIVPVSPEQAAEVVSAPQNVASSEYFKIIPDSELVYGPLGTLLNVDEFVQQQGGHLAYYTQEVDGETLSGAQILQKVATNYSVNPRILLAVLEYRSQWVTNPNPAPSTLDTPIAYIDNYRVGLYRQLAWAADRLNTGFYRWRAGGVETWTLTDKTLVYPQPGINAGSAGVQYLFSQLDDQAAWEIDTGPQGIYATYNEMFGYPFDFAIEPLLPQGLTQPLFSLPFGPNEIWAFTGGPHGGWDTGSAWAALDFAPPGDPIGCGQTDYWVTAVADGMIVRSANGSVVQDLDGDGIEQTGWTVLYLHIETRDRVEVGRFVKAGERIGHPSCEGGFTQAAHLHIARRYNGMWIPADDPTLNFVMDGWQVEGGNIEYDGWLNKDGITVEAWDGINVINQISR